ncbi:MAG: RNA polymerase sigma factor [Ignavibacteriae bacterium]|nr:RNA polymerase sigma factor [Ignavibacteriota bacterium]MCB9214870.1 RNA polymerase sigma factor [Ignavibacteria bacterium]
MSDNFSRYSDSRLFALLREEPKTKDQAFAELYARHSSRVWLYCLKIMGDRQSAEDMFQGTFLRFLQSATVEREMSNVPGFLLRIARNLCLNAKQKMRPITTSLEELELPVEEHPVEARELERLVSTALDLLPEEHREAFVLQAYNGMSYKEIAEMIDRPVTTVRNRVVRAKKKMREILAPYLVDYRE